MAEVENTVLSPTDDTSTQYYQMNHLIAKIQDRRYIEDMYTNEYLYFRFQKHFREGPKDSAGRNDPRDGNLFTEQVSWIEIQLPTGEKMKFVRGENMEHADHSEHLQEPTVNICCLTLIQLNEEFRPIGHSQRLSELGDSAILIYDTKKFYDTIEQSILAMGLTFEMKPVTYYNHKEHNGDLTFFDKENEFRWQNEYRILVWPNLNGDLKIPVPGLKSMSVLIESINLPDLSIQFDHPQTQDRL